MVRKSSIVATVLGTSLLTVAGLLVISGVPDYLGWVSRLLRRTPAVAWLAPFHAHVLAVNVAQLGIVSFWWPLLRRPPLRVSLLFSAVARFVGVLYLLIILGVALISGHMDPPLLVLSGVVLCIHFGVAAYLIRRPRLLLLWCLGVLIAALIMVPLVLLNFSFFTPGLDNWEQVTFAILTIVFLSLLLGPLLVLPFAWCWVKRAKAKGRC